MARGICIGRHIHGQVSCIREGALHGRRDRDCAGGDGRRETRTHRTDHGARARGRVRDATRTEIGVWEKSAAERPRSDVSTDA